MDLTPVQSLNGMWYKREDLYRGAYGVNGAKYRACQHLIGRAAKAGYACVVSAASVLSPQSAMAAVVSDEYGLMCHVIVGGTTPEKAVKHKSIQIARDAGALISSIPVGYNPALQSAAKKSAEQPGSWRLPYGITTPPDASPEEVEGFLQVGAAQTMNLPDGVKTLVLPFGSGNTAAGVLYGLHDFAPEQLERVILVGIGPDRQAWLRARLALVGRELVPAGVQLQHIPLHPGFATYGDRMPETLDGLALHPTYEGKVARYLNLVSPSWWTARDDTTLLWIVGGPL